jgi:hypothetical protein
MILRFSNQILAVIMLVLWRLPTVEAAYATWFMASPSTATVLCSPAPLYTVYIQSLYINRYVCCNKLVLS